MVKSSARKAENTGDIDFHNLIFFNHTFNVSKLKIRFCILLLYRALYLR